MPLQAGQDALRVILVIDKPLIACILTFTFLLHFLLHKQSNFKPTRR